MKKSFMTRALATGLSLAMAFSLSAATNVTTAAAAVTPAMRSSKITLEVGQTKNYRATAATQKAANITISKVKISNAAKAELSVKRYAKKKYIAVTGIAATASTRNVVVTFKNSKTKKTTKVTMKATVKGAEKPEPEKPVEATKIVEAKPTTAKTVLVTFDGIVDTSTATAIKLTRGTTDVTVKAAYASDSKSVTLTSDTTFAAGTYTVTIGSFEPVSFNVTKQTPTALKITNTKVANKSNARVYFQVLDQYNDVMENYTDNKLQITAYNASKGHDIELSGTTKKDYFVLNCSTETTAPSGGYLNSVGDKVSIVAYLKDNASISCTTELEIVRIYTESLEFGDIKLGDDKRVTVNKTYELIYTAKDTEGKDVTFDEQSAGDGASSAATVKVDDYNFVSSNISAVDMRTVSVDSNGRLSFVAGNTPGTAVITAINIITGKTSTVTIVVNDIAKLSSLDIADASVACNATEGTTFKAAATAYDQFGDMLDAKNVKNIPLAAGQYFNSVTPTPSGPIDIVKITSDGKYVEYKVANALDTYKNQSVTFNFISKAMGDAGYIKSTSLVSVGEEIEASALDIVKEPDATVEEGKKISIQFAVKDQYQNKIESASGSAFSNAVIEVEQANSILASTTPYIKTVPGEDKVYEMELAAASLYNKDLYKSGTFTLKLRDGQRVIASKPFNLVVIGSVSSYGVTTNKTSYKAGEAVEVTVDSYSTVNGSRVFNPYYNKTVAATAVVSRGGMAQKTYSQSLKFENGVANFKLTAGTQANDYVIVVTDKTTNVTGTSDKYDVIAGTAGKLQLNTGSGKLEIADSEGNSTNGTARTSFATIKVTDENTGADITDSIAVSGVALKADKTLDATINENNVVTKLDDYEYDFADGITITGVPDTSANHNLILSVTIEGMTWEKKIAYTTGNAVFNDSKAASDKSTNVATATANANDDYTIVRTALTNAKGTSVGGIQKIATSYTVVSGSSVVITTSGAAVDAIAVSQGGTTYTGDDALARAELVGTDSEIGINIRNADLGNTNTDKIIVKIRITVTGKSNGREVPVTNYVTATWTVDGSSNWVVAVTP